MFEKKTISAKEVIDDIKVGMTQEQLMLKHGLSAKGFESLKNKLLTAGLLTQAELNGKSPATQVTDLSTDQKAFAKNIAEAVKIGHPDDSAEAVRATGGQDHRTTGEIRGGFICPKCNTPQSPDREECLRCGVVFSKLQSDASKTNSHPGDKRTGEQETRYKTSIGRRVVAISALAMVVLFSIGGYSIITYFNGNQHDVQLEAAQKATLGEIRRAALSRQNELWEKRRDELWEKGKEAMARQERLLSDQRQKVIVTKKARQESLRTGARERLENELKAELHRLKEDHDKCWQTCPALDWKSDWDPNRSPDPGFGLPFGEPMKAKLTPCHVECETRYEKRLNECREKYSALLIELVNRTGGSIRFNISSTGLKVLEESYPIDSLAE